MDMGYSRAGHPNPRPTSAASEVYGVYVQKPEALVSPNPVAILGAIISMRSRKAAGTECPL